MSYVQSLFHIVICTKGRKMSINEEHKKELYKYIWGILKNDKCELIRINGIPNHVHILVDVHQQICIADLVRNIKRASSIWLKSQKSFSQFDGWGHEYAAFACSYEMKETIKTYIINQEKHHKTETFDTEYQNVISANGLAFYSIG